MGNADVVRERELASEYSERVMYRLESNAMLSKPGEDRGEDERESDAGDWL